MLMAETAFCLDLEVNCWFEQKFSVRHDSGALRRP